MTTLNSRTLGLGLALLMGSVAAGTAQVVMSAHVRTAQELQNALTFAAANGFDDIIYLAGVRYVGNFNYNSAETNSLTLQAEDNVSNESILIDGAGTGRSMNLACTANALITVHGITFLRNCGGYQNAGLRVSTGNGGDVVIEDCRFISPTNTAAGLGLELVSGRNATVRECTAVGAANGAGQGVSIQGFSGTVIFQSCVVASNTIAVQGPGLAIGSGSVIEVRDSTFTGNSGMGYSSGGGLNCNGSTVTLSNNVFTGNSGYMGGGAYCQGSVLVTVTDNTFTTNTCSAAGGGAYCFNATVMVSGNTFTGNSSSGGTGGGLGCDGTTVTVSNNTFSANSAGSGGGVCSGSAGVFTCNTFTGNSAGNAGGGVFLNGAQAQVSLTGNTFARNTAARPGGGAYCLGRLTVAGNKFRENTAAEGGGGLYADGSAVSLVNNLIARNQQSGAGYGGGGLWLRTSTTLDMINNTICANTNAGTGGVGGGVALSVQGVTEVLNVYNNIIWNNTARGSGGDVYVAGTGSQKTFTYNAAHDMAGVWDKATPLDLDPQFFDPVNGDYHVRSGSPCVDAGTNLVQLPPTDLDGGPRVAAGKVDMGCYEFDNQAKHPADVNDDWVIDATEYDNYSTAWKTDQIWSRSPNVIPADYVTRAGFLQVQNAGRYQNDGSARPICWKTRP